ncbi:MAG: peptidoglycan-associated lipoprotein, partial [Gammaproteobacteria bacterium]|nr:peptidoglycan-associated lipoprotein [Gammaproteobacteria bacterium]
MTRQLFGALSVLVLAGAMLSGCQSPPKEPVEEPVVVDPPPAKVTPPPRRPDPGPPLDEDMRALDPDGNPLNSTFYFEYDQARLAAADIRVLAMHAQILRGYRNLSVNIEGHCDERGTREYNLA